MSTILIIAIVIVAILILVLFIINKLKASDNQSEGKKKVLKEIFKQKGKEVEVINELIKKNSKTDFNSIDDIIDSLP